MAGLMDLPVELQLNVISFVESDLPSFLHFALANKYLYKLCKHRFGKHREMHSEWALLNSSAYGDNAKPFRELVITILHNSDIATYIRELRVCHSGWGGQSSAILSEDMMLIREPISTASFASDDLREAWLGFLEYFSRERDCSALMTLLLPLLPRLRTLDMSECEAHHLLESLLNWLPDFSGAFPALKTLLCSGKGSQFTTDVNKVIQCPVLPALEDLTAFGVSGLPGHYFICPERKGTYALRKLRLVDSQLRPVAIAAILPGTKLELFKYSHRRVEHVLREEHFDGPGIIEVLLQYARTTLTELDLGICWHYYQWCNRSSISSDLDLQNGRSQDIITLGPRLKDFKALKSLYVQGEMLVEGWRAWTYDRDSVKDPFEVVDQSVRQVPLRNILPRSLQTLRISLKFPNMATIVVEKLTVLMEEDYDTVPNLRKIQIPFNVYNDLARLWIACEQRNVELADLH